MEVTYDNTNLDAVCAAAIVFHYTGQEHQPVGMDPSKTSFEKNTVCVGSKGDVHIIRVTDQISMSVLAWHKYGPVEDIIPSVVSLLSMTYLLPPDDKSQSYLFSQGLALRRNIFEAHDPKWWYLLNEERDPSGHDIVQRAIQDGAAVEAYKRGH